MMGSGFRVHVFGFIVFRVPGLSGLGFVNHWDDLGLYIMEKKMETTRMGYIEFVI